MRKRRGNRSLLHVLLGKALMTVILIATSLLCLGNKTGNFELVVDSVDFNSVSVAQELSLDEVNLLASVTNSERDEFYLLEGTIEEPTYTERRLYIYNPKIKDRQKFSLAGKTYDMLKELIYEARIFYGYCSREFPNSIVWYQRELLESDTWEESYFIIDLNHRPMKMIRMEPDEKKLLKRILENLELQNCSEVPGTISYEDP
ncbi:hypothetical protein EYV94_16405 [Puteibacter caeruleilacunae]|nr:hypothetical protein EYV94_16405 [Puteibacter caeruleilacunae]